MNQDVRQGLGTPSAFFQEHQPRLIEAAHSGGVLDVACGRGRHTVAAADLGFSVLAIDRDQAALDQLGKILPRGTGRITTLQIDLESEPPPALEPAAFTVVLVFRYLHRPLAAWIQSLVSTNGILLYETFTQAQRKLAWGPTRDAFLLEPGELPSLFPELKIERYEEGPARDERAPQTARMLATREP
jgi:SAM-dependent methyltransferase